MARCRCRWRRVLVCVCTPCVVLALLFVYVTLAVCSSMASGGAGTGFPAIFEQPLFVSPGAVVGVAGLAPAPSGPFWSPHPHGNALWNRLQLRLDRQFNPLLRPRPRTQTSASAVGRPPSPPPPSDSERFSEIADPASRLADFDAMPELMRDFVRSMHRRRYPVLTEPPDGGCGAGRAGQRNATLLLLAIKTQEGNFANRQAIRQTWGRAGWVAGGGGDTDSGGGGGGFVRRVFLLGKNRAAAAAAPLPDTTALLRMESQHYRDLLQWDFSDTFFNLTLKDVLFWDWFSRRCPGAAFVFKGDDDVLVRTPALLDYLQGQLERAGGPGGRGLRGFMAGEVIGAATPVREASQKYYVPPSFYAGLYPAYAGGGGVVYSGTLARRLNRVQRRVELFPIDDVFVGMCLLRLRGAGGPLHHPAFLTFDFPKKEAELPCRYHTVLVVHKRSPAQVREIWRQLDETRAQCRNATLRVDELDGRGTTKRPALPEV